MPPGRRPWPSYAPWEFYLGQMSTVAILVPLFVVAWWVTGGPNGAHRTLFWVVAVAGGVLAVVLAGRLPPPWNGRRRDSHGRSRRKRTQHARATRGCRGSRSL